MIDEKVREIKEEIESKIADFDSTKSLHEFRKSFLDNK